MQKSWSVLFGAVLFAELLLTALAPVVGWWLPPLANEGSFGEAADFLFYLILGFTGFFFVLTEAILVYTMWRYAGKPGQKALYIHGNHKLELTWTVVPAAILLLIAFTQINTWADIKYASRTKPPQQILEVSARQFEWRIRYPEKDVRKKYTVESEGDSWQTKADADRWGSDTLADFNDLYVVNEVHTWKGANTRIYLKTRDVLHSFFLPNMRLKQDAVPGKIIPIWFKPTDHNGVWTDEGWVYEKDKKSKKDKVWELACAELCGWGHYKMQGQLYVHEDEESYHRWLEDALKKHRAKSRE